jgi:hypothetical protein
MAEQSSHVMQGGVPAVITEFCNFRFLSNATTEYYNCLGGKTINQNVYSIFNLDRPKSREKKDFKYNYLVITNYS